ncbi:hypothetical protein FHG87_007648 [Trinorchestia longiramus]|nr:hypothetical protein FHG87_007648 [Trinorchestia longiramus]
MTIIQSEQLPRGAIGECVMDNSLYRMLGERSASAEGLAGELHERHSHNQHLTAVLAQASHNNRLRQGDVQRSNDTRLAVQCSTQQHCSTLQQQHCSTLQQQHCSTLQQQHCSTLQQQHCSAPQQQCRAALQYTATLVLHTTQLEAAKSYKAPLNATSPNVRLDHFHYHHNYYHHHHCHYHHHRHCHYHHHHYYHHHCHYHHFNSFATSTTAKSSDDLSTPTSVRRTVHTHPTLQNHWFPAVTWFIKSASTNLLSNKLWAPDEAGAKSLNAGRCVWVAAGQCTHARPAYGLSLSPKRSTQEIPKDSLRDLLAQNIPFEALHNDSNTSMNGAVPHVERDESIQQQVG